MSRSNQNVVGLPTATGALLFVSGACSVGFEVLWSAQLARVLGGSTAAVAFVVAIFMGGMAIGYAAGGKLAWRVRRPLAAYGVAEIALAISGVLSVHVLPWLERAVSLPVAYTLAALVLLPITFLAGITLPLLVDATRGAVGGAVGRLYALNTAGAVSGVLVVGMFGIGALGLSGAGHALGMAGAGVGVTACVLGRRPRSRAGSSSTGSAPEASRVVVARSEPHVAFPRGLALVLALLVGVASLGEEVLWTRALLPHINSSVYALSAILAVFLLGLAIGARLATLVVERGRDPAIWLGTTQIAAGLLVLFSPEALLLAEHAITGYVGVRQIGGLGSWLATVVTSLARVCLALLPPTILLGMALPLLVELYAREIGERGLAMGRLGSANTIGAVLGSLGARFVLLPALGLGMALQALTLVHAFVAAAAIGARSRKPLWLLLPASLCVSALVRSPAAPFLGRLVEGRSVVLVHEGAQDTTAVVELEDGSRQIFSNGIAYAGDSSGAKRYMRLLGHLPALLARRQKRAMVICIGTGMTASAVARHPAFRTIDLVDISAVVHRTLPLFARSNDRVYRDPRVRFHIEDGRVRVARANRRSYDVITMEPPPPRAAGVAALYSRELYEQGFDLLADGGAFTQWLPVHGMTGAELRMLARTFVDVLPEAVLYRIHDVEAALVATRGPGASDSEIERRLAVPGVRDHLASIGVPDPRALPSVRGRALERLLGKGPIVTDDHPRIEHFAAGLGDGPDEDTDEAAARFLEQAFGPRPRD